MPYRPRARVREPESTPTPTDVLRVWVPSRWSQDRPLWMMPQKTFPASVLAGVWEWGCGCPVGEDRAAPARTFREPEPPPRATPRDLGQEARPSLSGSTGRSTSGLPRRSRGGPPHSPDCMRRWRGERPHSSVPLTDKGQCRWAQTGPSLRALRSRRGSAALLAMYNRLTLTCFPHPRVRGR